MLLAVGLLLVCLSSETACSSGTSSTHTRHKNSIIKKVLSEGNPAKTSPKETPDATPEVEDVQTKDLDLLADLIKNTKVLNKGPPPLEIYSPQEQEKPKKKVCFLKVAEALDIEPPVEYSNPQIDLDLQEIYSLNLRKVSSGKVEVNSHFGSVGFAGKTFLLNKLVIKAGSDTSVVRLDFPLEMIVYGSEVSGQEAAEFDRLFQREADSEGAQPRLGLALSVLFEESEYANQTLYEMGFGTGSIKSAQIGDNLKIKRFSLEDFLGKSVNKFFFWKSANSLVSKSYHSNVQSKEHKNHFCDLQKFRSNMNHLITSAREKGEGRLSPEEEVSLNLTPLDSDETLWMSMFITVDISPLQSAELSPLLYNTLPEKKQQQVQEVRVFQNFDPEKSIVQLIRSSWIDPQLLANQLVDLNLPLPRFTFEEEKKAWQHDMLKYGSMKYISKLKSVSDPFPNMGPSTQESIEGEDWLFDLDPPEDASNSLLDVDPFADLFISSAQFDKMEQKALLDRQSASKAASGGLKGLNPFAPKDTNLSKFVSEFSHSQPLQPQSSNSQDANLFQQISEQDLEASPIKQSEIFEINNEKHHQKPVPKMALFPWEFNDSAYDSDKIFILKDSKFPRSIKEGFSYAPLFYYLSPLKLCVGDRLLFIPYLVLVEDGKKDQMRKPVLRVDVFESVSGEIVKFRYAKEETQGDRLLETYDCDGKMEGESREEEQSQEKSAQSSDSEKAKEETTSEDSESNRPENPSKTNLAQVQVRTAQDAIKKINIGQLGIFGKTMRDAPSKIENRKKIRAKAKSGQSLADFHVDQLDLDSTKNMNAHQADRHLRTMNERAILFTNKKLKSMESKLQSKIDKLVEEPSSKKQLNSLNDFLGSSADLKDLDQSNLTKNKFLDIYSGTFTEKFNLRVHDPKERQDFETGK